MKSCIPTFLHKGDLKIIKNYRGITLISRAAKVYNVLLLNCIQPEIKKILRKYQDGFQRSHSTTSEILIICWIIERVQAKNLEAKVLFIDFCNAFDFMHREKIEQILFANAFPVETVPIIMMLYKNIKAIIH